MNVLLTSVGRRSYIVKYFKEALDGGKVICVNAEGLSTAMCMADKSYISPLVYSDEYIDFLLDICKKEKIDFIISLFDIDLRVLSKNRRVFEEQGIRLIVSDYEITNICNDKWKMFLYLTKRGFKVPRTFLSYKEPELKKIFKQAKKVMIKPRWGMGSLGIYEADNFEELEIFYNKTKKDILSTYLKYEASEDTKNCIIIQEKLEGKEYGLDIINDLNKNYVTTIVKEKIAMRAGETDIARVVRDKNIENFGASLSKELGHIANMDTDIILCGKEEYVIDLNARFGGGYPFSHEAGANLVGAIVEWISGNKETEIKIRQTGIYAKNLEVLRL